MELYATWNDYLASARDYYIDEENIADQKVREKIQGFDVIGSSRVGTYQIYEGEKLFGIIDVGEGTEKDQLDLLEIELGHIRRGFPVDRYYYSELLMMATNETATQNDINRLGEWFELFGQSFWNGECYDADGKDLYPIYEAVDEDDYEITGYEFR